MIKHIVTQFDVKVTQKWECPNCGTHNTDIYNGKPYRMMAENPIDSICDECEEFFTLSFYNEEEVKRLNEELESLDRINRTLKERGIG